MVFAVVAVVRLALGAGVVAAPALPALALELKVREALVVLQWRVPERVVRPASVDSAVLVLQGKKDCSEVDPGSEEEELG